MLKQTKQKIVFAKSQDGVKNAELYFYFESLKKWQKVISEKVMEELSF
jgi:hypothetical protein